MSFHLQRNVRTSYSDKIMITLKLVAKFILATEYPSQEVHKVC